MNDCKTCIHCIPSDAFDKVVMRWFGPNKVIHTSKSYSFAICGASGFGYCSMARAEDGGCGISGKNWEEIPNKNEHRG